MISEKLRVLIVGYGRAGKRHGALLDHLGLKWSIIDPGKNIACGVMIDKSPLWQYIDLSDAFSKWPFDLLVVCTPPNTHLGIIRNALDLGVPRILCEKPLCGLGQMEEAQKLAEKAGDRVSVAYNWRWHPHVLNLSEQEAPVESIHLYSSQHRPDLPDWGLLLDHVSHGLDTLRQIVDGEPKIELVTDTVVKKPNFEIWTVNGVVDGCVFMIDDVVHFDEHCPPRECFISVDHVRHDLDTAPETLDMMYRWMWDDVMAWVEEDQSRPPASMADALETQALLERAHELNEKQKAYFADKAARRK